GRTALDGGADVDVLGTQAHRDDHPVEQLPGGAREGPSAALVLFAGSLPDEEQLRRRAAAREDRARAVDVQLAARACGCLGGELLETGTRLARYGRRSRRHRAHDRLRRVDRDEARAAQLLFPREVGLEQIAQEGALRRGGRDAADT